MPFLFAAFIVGVACGLRAIVGLAAVSWAASEQLLPLQGSWLALLGNRFTPYVTTALAVGELINDKLPKTPSRLVPPQFGARVVMGAITGAAIGIPHGQWVVGAVVGVIGSVVGTFCGAKGRGLAAKLFGRDFPAALLEDVLAVALAFMTLYQVR
jgi:uncharacterized membrane protein